MVFVSRISECHRNVRRPSAASYVDRKGYKRGLVIRTWSLGRYRGDPHSCKKTALGLVFIFAEPRPHLLTKRARGHSLNVVKTSIEVGDVVEACFVTD